MKTYDKYKFSGIDWIGDIPEHWELKRLKFFAKVNSPISSFEIDKSSDDEVVFLPMEKVSEGGEINQELRKQINEASSGFTYFEKGDVILAKITPCFENGKGALLENLETDFGFGSTEFHTLRASERVSSKLLFYITKSHSFRTLGEAFMSGSAGQKRVSTDFVKDFPIAFPTLPEQTAIADYLDEKTAQIDKLIAEKRRLIELLKEERLGVINQAVTRGINPHAKLKPSGITWLSDIPQHWEVKKLKFVSEINSTTLAEKHEEDFQIKYIDIGSVNSEGKVSQIADFLSSEAPSRARRIVKSGDTIVSTVRTYLRAIAFIEKDIENLICSTGFAVIRPSENLIGKFLFSICHSPIFVEKVVALSKGVSYPAIDSEDIKNLEVWFPLIEEQKQIVEFIETATGKIDATITTIEKEIGFLREYRTALISEVVTGKIKVC